MNQRTDTRIRKYLPLINYVINKWYSHYNDRAALYSEGQLALLYADRRYKEGSTASFKTYATTAIRNNCFNIIKKKGNQRLYKKWVNYKGEVKIEYVNIDDCTLMDNDYELEQKAKEGKDFILSILKRTKLLTKKQKQIIKLYYFANKGQAAIAKKHNVTKQYVSYVVKNIITCLETKVRKELF